MRKAMVEPDHPQLSVRKQCELLGVNRNRLTAKDRQRWQPKPGHAKMLEMIPGLHAQDPTMGARQLQRLLKRNGHKVGRWTVKRMMEYLGIKAIYCKPRTTIPAPGHPKYPYLLRNREITEPDEVWAIASRATPPGRTSSLRRKFSASTKRLGNCSPIWIEPGRGFDRDRSAGMAIPAPPHLVRTFLKVDDLFRLR